MDDPICTKVAEIFNELTGGNANLPSQGMPLIKTVSSALQDEFGADVANDIGFHLADWIEEAAFILALHLYPDRFTTEEISEGIRSFLIHVPNHVAAAASLAGFPVDDIFDTR